MKSGTFSSKKDWDRIFRRVSTMMFLDGRKSPGRSAAGPERGPVQELLDFFLDEARVLSAGLVRNLSEEQRRQDAREWFKGATEYVERTAVMQEQRPELFTDFPFRPSDLRARLARVGLLGLALEAGERFLQLLSDTQKVEQADLMHMCDLLVEEVQAQASRPATPKEERAALMNLASIPLALWNARLEEIRRRRADTEELRGQLSDATARAEVLSEKNAREAPAAPATARIEVERPLAARGKRQRQR